ncbi:Lysophospholipase, alpha-beta hydrolase superfamily [Polaribacter sp. Hel1_33_78]|uniref:alpha/beta hydrolase n=1 Tax=Polaribacter sp. Hel1_33_78 TaxID=1336804 RepID=UPI000879C415|nr:alpha/beta fold hydrolase [Polaribacter sp. Hel1_33_78]MDG1195931.1 alpha/beta fold hydrolase [Polaribacter sp.]SDU06882.1 Lysophospholipase, alpha-beta hydrolase superfamily [Polaribacter sp. Hel1_33_78]
MERVDFSPLLFIHGLCHGAWCWHEHFIPHFESLGYDCHTLNLSGHEVAGRSASNNHLKLSDYVKDVENAISTFDTQPILVGHSMGGFIVQLYLKNCRLPTKAILMASVPPSGALASSLRVIKIRPGAIKYLLNRDLLGFAQAYPQFMFRADIDSHALSYYKSMLCSESFVAYLQMLFPIAIKKSTAAHHNLLVMGGSKDQLFTLREFEYTARKYAADLEIIPDAAHDLMLEPNWKYIAKIIHYWINKLDTITE